MQNKRLIKNFQHYTVPLNKKNLRQCFPRRFFPPHNKMGEKLRRFLNQRVSYHILAQRSILHSVFKVGRVFCQNRVISISPSGRGRILKYTLPNWQRIVVRLNAENGFASPWVILQTHPILKEHFKLRRITDVCTLYAGVFVSDSLLHMLPYKI